MKHATIARVLLAGLVAAAGGCTMKSQDAPPLAGPSELGTSISVTVSPDVLSLDGASQSLVTITARDSKGAPARNISLRTEIAVDGVFTDYGTLSARNVVTDSSGRATLVYTAPIADTDFAVDTGTVVDILVTPIGTDFNNSTPRLASIRLVPVGIVVPPDGLQPAFTFAPDTPSDHQSVLFDASTSRAPSNNPIASYSWNFGDGSNGSGITATHSYDSPGAYFVKLTIKDGIGRSAFTTQTVTVAQGALPSAAFTFSPSSPQVNQTVNFTAASSTPGTGRRIVSYQWDFGDGDSKTTTSPQTSHDFVTAGAFQVTLVVTDDAGRTASNRQTVTVGAPSAPVANFTFSPTDPAPGQAVSFNGSTSTTGTGRSIATYSWDFGDGSPIVTSSNPIASHTFGTENTFTVTLTVTDDAGKVGRVTKTVVVKFP